MAKEQKDWKQQLEDAFSEISAEENTALEQRRQESMVKIRKNLTRDFVLRQRVVVNLDTAKVDYAATQEAIQVSGEKADIENLIEASIERGEFVIYNYEPYSLLAMIQEPFWDKENDCPKKDELWGKNCHLSINEIKTAIAEKYPWMQEDQYQKALTKQVEIAMRTRVLVEKGYLSQRSKEDAFDFFKNNMPQLDPIDGGQINPFLKDPFSGRLDYD